jgi:hypothetical protein
MHKNPEFWNGLPKVEITVEHIDRALKAMGNDLINLTRRDVPIESAMLAGGVIAYMEAADGKLPMSSLLAALAEEVICHDYLRDWAIHNYGLIDPMREQRLRQDEERNAMLAERNAKARIKREANMAAKREVEIEAEVQKRLAQMA